MKVVVTGAAGYVGSVVSRYLLDAGHDVVGVDLLLQGGHGLAGMWGVDPRFTFYKADIRSKEDMSRIFKSESPDAVFNFAAIVGDPACKRWPDDARSTNLDACVLMADLVAEIVPQALLVFVSTCSNYGVSNTEDLIDENYTLNPVSLYAETKVAAERYLLDHKGTFKRTALRLSTAYGLSARMRFDLTVSDFAKEAVVRKKLVIFGEQFWRPYVHTVDIARLAVLLTQDGGKKSNGQIFNVGNSDENYQKQTIAEELVKLIPDLKIEYVKQVSDPRSYRVSFAKIERELGFRTVRTVPKGLAEVIEALSYGLYPDPDHPKYYNVPPQ